MGTWNGTCGLSNLSINCGEKIKLIILRKSNTISGYAGNCEPNDNYVPIAFPISGTYDDYGCIENIVRDINVETIEKIFNENIEQPYYVLEGYENKFFFVDKKLYSLSDVANKKVAINSIVNWIERGEIHEVIKDQFINNGKAEEYKITFMIMREDVYNLAIKLGSDIWKQNSCLLKDYKNIVKVCKDLSSGKNLTEEQKCIANLKIGLISALFFDERMYNYVAEIFLKQLTTSEKIDLLTILKYFEECKSLWYFLKFSRKEFCEQSGCGSQNDNHNLMNNFYSGILKIIDKAKEES